MNRKRLMTKIKRYLLFELRRKQKKPIVFFFITLLQTDAAEQIEKIEQTPMELNNDEMPTKTRFSGRKDFSNFFDSTTQIIQTKV